MLYKPVRCELRCIGNVLEFLLALVQADCAIRDRKSCGTPSQVTHGFGSSELSSARAGREFQAFRGRVAFRGRGVQGTDGISPNDSEALTVVDSSKALAKHSETDPVLGSAHKYAPIH